jgi:phage/conjugal plasmid C-4 type zinc finger TraR family protein
MAVGWASDGAVYEQMADTISDAVQKARQQLPQGQSLTECQQCGEPIPEKRRQALPGVKLCRDCQSAKEGSRRSEYFNRRGSKDSQLR